MNDLDWVLIILFSPIIIFFLGYTILSIVELITGKYIKSLEGL